ncbi:MAG: sigma-70 family RNA polymerase sigma factor [Acidobacteriia bacterium]|nr:sigma-70 family RNA polymerase sigma factor [Terriglobia bacterium]
MVLDGTERELIEACQRGEPEGFRALFELHKSRVYSIALHFANDEASAMDIAQDTFLKLFSSIQAFRGEGSFESWLYRIVVNCCFDRKREGRRFLPLMDRILDGLRCSGETALHKLLREELSGQVRSAVGKLLPEQRIVIVLRYTEGLSYEEIAEVLGCSRGTVASRLNRAHRILERRLAHLTNHVCRDDRRL